MTLRLAKIAALTSAIVSAVYALLQIEPSSIVGLFLVLAPLLVVILWLQQDAQRTGVGAVHDWGLFLWFAWPVLIPWYSFKTRGPAWWRLTAGLFALILAPYLSAFVVVLVMWAFAFA